ncbi:hypothetical protein VN1227_02950 [Helicobacter pylori]|nr:hypothetical protein VN1227_02950 [Helicobacter pylori]
MRDAQRIEIRDKKHAIISPRNYRTKALFKGVRVLPKCSLIFLRRHFAREF